MRPVKIERTYLMLHIYKDKTTRIQKQYKQGTVEQAKCKDEKTQELQLLVL
jgi:hypothetical protein